MHAFNSSVWETETGGSIDMKQLCYLVATGRCCGTQMFCFGKHHLPVAQTGFKVTMQSRMTLDS